MIKYLKYVIVILIVLWFVVENGLAQDGDEKPPLEIPVKELEVIPSTQSSPIPFWFPLVMNQHVEFEPYHLMIRGKLPPYKFLSTVSIAGIPPHDGYSMINLDMWSGDDIPSFNLTYHPEVNLITRFPFYDPDDQSNNDFFEYIDPNTYQVLGRIEAPEPYKDYIDLHDVRFSPDGTRVAMTIYKETEELYEVQGREVKLLDFILVETPWPQDGTITFEWHGVDHWDYNDSDFDLADDRDNYDYAHVNSIDYHPLGNFMLISNRHMSEVTHIDLNTGDIVWRLGGKKSDFIFTDDDGFSYQHTAEYTDYGVMVFDNANLTGGKSRYVEYELDVHFFEANKHREYVADFFSPFQGSVFRYFESTPDEITVIGWGGCRRTTPDCPLFTILDKYDNMIAEVSIPYNIVQYSSYRTTLQP